MKFFEFRQNNSGGGFKTSPDLDTWVFIEARDEDEANYFAGRLGIYFDGVDNGKDCACCGDRWDRAYRGDDVPSMYGDSVDLNALDPNTVIHYRDGRVLQSPERAAKWSDQLKAEKNPSA
jgi:hypothetical protein